MQRDLEVCLTESKAAIPPAPDEIEISLFGPSYGESILIHLGDNEWLIVDSCINPSTKKSLPLEYLESIGADPSHSIKLIVASHWDDDHVRGIAEVVEKCTSAEFVTSDAMKSKEFLTLVSALGQRSMMKDCGAQEFYNILLKIKGTPDTQLLRFAIAERLIFKKTLTATKPNMNCEIITLSPSDEAVIQAMKEIGNLLPKAGAPKIRAIQRRPNFYAVVLWIKIGNIQVLLGSDLEETKDSKTGWSVIVDSHIRIRPKEKADIFKLPHHGSSNAYCSSVWSEMLKQDPIALLTPFKLGSTVLPTRSDVRLILSHTKHAFSSASLITKKPKGRSKTVEKTIRETVRSIREVNASVGHARLRTKNSDPPITWSVTLFGDAIALDKIY